MADEQHLIKIASWLARNGDIIVERFAHYIIHDFYGRHRVSHKNCLEFRVYLRYNTISIINNADNIYPP